MRCCAEVNKHLKVDYAVCNVKPESVSCTFGAPEQVRSVYQQRQGADGDKAVMMNGPAADMWSVGMVAYVMVSLSSSLCGFPVMPPKPHI